MPQMPLNLDTIKDLDPAIAAEFEAELWRVSVDLSERPHEDKPRKITVEFSFTPYCQQAGVLDSSDVDVTIKSTMPAVRSRKFSLRRRHQDGALLFNPASPDNVHQRTLDDVGDNIGDDIPE